MIKCLLLKFGATLITEINEVSGDVGEPDCQLINPFEIMSDGSLVRWPNVTDQRSMKIHSDSILTIVDPTQDILAKYKEFV